MKKSILLSYIIGLYFVKVRQKIYKNKIKARKRRFMYRRAFLDKKDTHQAIFDLLTSNQPVMIARYGFTEAQVVGEYSLIAKGLKRKYSSCADWLYNTAGFFSNNENNRLQDLERFSKLMIEDSGFVDLLGVHYGLFEDYDVNSFCGKAVLTEFDNLRIMDSNNSWGKALKDKKVLVVHPFAKT